MSDLAITVLTETLDDGPAIERLVARTFGPGRFVRSAFRIRERVKHDLKLSFTARIGTLLVGSVRLTPILIGQTPALLLGPITVEPPFRSRGIGRILIERALQAAKEQGHGAVLLVGDEAYYGRLGFKRTKRGQITMPGPVDPARVLVAELSEGLLETLNGPVRPDWARAEAV